MEVIWTSRTPDMGQTLNNVRAAGQIRTMFCKILMFKVNFLGLGLLSFCFFLCFFLYMYTYNLKHNASLTHVTSFS